MAVMARSRDALGIGTADLVDHPGGSRLAVGVLSGSPRHGNCEHLARVVLAPAVESAGCAASVAALRSYVVAPCVGCGSCARTGVCSRAGREAAHEHSRPGFLSLLSWLDSLDALVLVAPLYFAGPPAQLKAFLDRLQFLWARRYPLGLRPPLPECRRRPLAVVAVGGGGDPFGSSALLSCARSALRMADFELACSCELIGYRTGREDVAPDEEFERRASACAAALAREALARGAFERRGQIDPFVPDAVRRG